VRNGKTFARQSTLRPLHVSLQLMKMTFRSAGPPIGGGSGSHLTFKLNAICASSFPVAFTPGSDPPHNTPNKKKKTPQHFLAVGWAFRRAAGQGRLLELR